MFTGQLVWLEDSVCGKRWVALILTLHPLLSLATGLLFQWTLSVPARCYTDLALLLQRESGW